MRNQWLGIIGLLVLCAAPYSQAQQPGNATEKAIMALEDQWLESEKTNNADLAAPLFADKYIATAPDGSIGDKAQTLADQKARKFTLSENEDVKVLAYGNTAIATGGWKGQGTEAGKPFNEHMRWTDTWIKKPDGKWILIASHYSTIKPKK
jgi:ketosteroid isomerase-like protein